MITALDVFRKQTKGTKGLERSFVPCLSMAKSNTLFFEKITDIGDVTAPLTEILKIMQITGRGYGQIARGLEVLGREFLGNRFVLVENMIHGDLTFDFVVEGISKGKKHHLHPALLGRDGLQSRRVLNFVVIDIPFSNDHIAIDQFYQTDFKGHVHLLGRN